MRVKSMLSTRMHERIASNVNDRRLHVHAAGMCIAQQTKSLNVDWKSLVGLPCDVVYVLQTRGEPWQISSRLVSAL